MIDTPRRILIIDDNEAIHADFRKTLASRAPEADLSADEALLFGAQSPEPRAQALSVQIDSAFQGQEGLARVQEALAAGQPYHVAFVDMRMPPGWDGVQTIERLWSADPRLQVVICTAYSDCSWAQIIERLGMSDRLLILKKPFDDVEVCQLTAAMTEKWRMTQQAELKLHDLEQLVETRTAELKAAALHDRLTGMPNRQLFNDRLQQAIARARRDPHRRFAVLFLDFDRFKVVNDSLGHQVGDELLVSIAGRLREGLRATDTVSPLGGTATAARLGGDEFIILLEDLRCDEDAARVAERLLHLLSDPHAVQDHEIRVSASIGVTTSALPYADADQMIRDADTAMYRAKAAGKARYVMFDQKMHDEAVQRLTLENDLRLALTRGGFALAYQPIMCLRTGQVAGFEALLRWHHPLRGLVMPNDFIPLAEETGLIVPMGAWVIHQAARQLADWQRCTGRPDLFVSVNVSRHQLGTMKLSQHIAEVLKETGLPPSTLKLEITESAVMQDPDCALAILRQIHAQGVRLMMDDFGTGYSSLSCLHRFPLEGLKIDRAFVNNTGERHDYGAVVNAIITLAHNLDIQLVAEGVETEDQVRMLREYDCDMAQGYFYARPAFAADLGGLIDTLRAAA